MNASRRSLSQTLSAWGYIAGWKIVAKLPNGFARWIFTIGADIASGQGTSPEQLRRNLERVVGRGNVTDSLVRDAMRSYLRYWREAFQLPTIAGPQLAQRVQHGFVQGCDRQLRRSIEGNTGTVLVLPHMGNWDMAGMWLVDQYGPFTTVAERLKPEVLFDAFVDYRQSLGFRILAHKGEQQPPFQTLERVLREGGIVALLGDRDLSAQGVPVNFFGETAFMPVGAALLAQRTQSRLFAVGLGFSEDKDGQQGWVQHIAEIVDLQRPVEQVVQEQADHFENFIRQHPTDWHMLQPLWASDLSKGRLERLGFDPDEGADSADPQG